MPARNDPAASASRARRLAEGAGLRGKRDIAAAVRALGIGGSDTIPVGDDCAAIPDGDGWLLFACEGFLNEFVAAEPDFAGWSGIMVNLSDIAAMGGRPIAVVDALWARGEDEAAPIMAGLRRASSAYQVPIVGGHTNLRNAADQLCVAVLGRARRLLTSFDAEPGDRLVAAIDLRGRWHEPLPFFDAASDAPPERLRAGLAILPEIAEAGLARAAKDISQGGVVGTLLMLLECSGVGALIDPEAVPRPPDTDLDRWLGAFPSFGFLIAAKPGDTDEILRRFEAAGIAAAVFGEVDATRRLAIRDGSVIEAVRDLTGEPLIGCAPDAEPLPLPMPGATSFAPRAQGAIAPGAA
ncbi:sll0787 family AIR synthase-like protein [Aureimonas sp. Leaf454]|uniref:sll0787 family AIR synthase-like protein n=1 Tax=Aureimonas sp. Leaf454 TaxID=1736381 RepID=UPI0009EC2E48|nr:sll0787 family AIR synthase-like protein [Aureimonas sp. Leaf454]